MQFGRTDYNKRIVDKDGKIPEDEPVFFLRAQDKFAPELLLTWAMKFRLAGGDPELASNAEEHAQKMINWQSIHGCKVPDFTDQDKLKKLLKEQINDLLNSGDVSNIRKLQDSISRYFDSDIDHLLVLMDSDLKDEYRSLVQSMSPTGLTLNLDWFEFEFDKSELESFEFIIYANKYKFYVLKSWK